MTGGRLHACPDCGAACVCSFIACAHECDPPADELAEWDHHDEGRGAVPTQLMPEEMPEEAEVGHA